ncbi:MAG: hypothetical protein EWM73_00976 [Nitrospira sp.]|nr:MAG: hypothetical protein EWM73_00976 [Nitrospira sp.]
MRRVDDREGMQWLGGEAHIRANDGRSSRSRLLQWLSSEAMTLLAGAALGSLGTVGAMRAEGVKRHRRIGNRVVRVSSERSETMEQVRADERRVRDNGAGDMGTGTILAAFGLGLLAGAVATLLMTPESGASVRRRVKRGADTAQEELAGIVGEAKESWRRVRDDAQSAVTRTATKIKEAAKVTREAVAEGEISVPKTP